MKSLLLATAVVVVSVGAYAQGTVNFNNSKSTVGGNGAPVTFADTTLGVNSSIVAQLWAGPDAASLAPVGATLAFRDGAGVGFLNTTGQDTVRTINSVAKGAVATYQVVAWEIAKGATYDAAVAAGGYAGKSGVFTIKTGGDGEPAALPANLTTLTGFTVAQTIIPEPSTIALGALGLGALLWRRRS